MKRQQKQKIRFAVCIDDSEPDLVKRKIYQVLADDSAAKDNYIRVIDESGEDYLYPAAYFIFIEVPQDEDKTLLMT